jgi:capsule polysaccharide export protein KpsE/RkpR
LLSPDTVGSLSSYILRSTGGEALSTADEQHQDVAGNTSDLEIPVAELAAAIWQRRRWLGKVTGIGLILAVGYALSIPNQYTSTAQLMPPDAQALSNTSMLSALAGSGAVASLGGGLLNARTPAGTFIGILGSQSAQNDIIDRFNLKQVYHCKLYIDARKVLTQNTIINEDKNSGIISISVTDRNPKWARDIAAAYVEELDKLVNSLSTSSARREREFLEQRIKSIKTDLDASSVALSQFSSHNATLNPQSQGQALFESAAKLQGELITAQSEMSGLKAIYSDDNVRVREAHARVDELQSQLRKMGSIGGTADSADHKADQSYPSIRELPILGVTYSDLYRQMVMRESIYETLTKQYELAKVQEAKEIPPIKVLDEPQVAERKTSPHRATIVVLGFLLSVFAGITWILASALWDLTNGFHSLKVGGIALPRSIRDHDAVTPN